MCNPRSFRNHYKPAEIEAEPSLNVNKCAFILWLALIFWMCAFSIFRAAQKPREITATFSPWASTGKQITYTYTKDNTNCGSVYGPGDDGLWRGYSGAIITDTYPDETEAMIAVERICKPTEWEYVGGSDVLHGKAN